MALIPKSINELNEEWLSKLEKSDIGEIDWIDFKRRDTPNIGHCITSFLNKETGGIILIGIEKIKDKFEFESKVDFQKIIDEKISKYIGMITDPPKDLINIEVKKYKEKKILVIFVKSGSKFPYFYNGTIYLRHGSDTIPITDKRQIMSLLSHEMNLNKALRILKNEIKLIKKDTEIIMKAIPELSKGHSASNVLALFPKEIDDSRIREIFMVLEPYLLEKNILDSYHEILEKIGYINLRLELLKKGGHVQYQCESRFGTLPKDLVSLLDGFEKNI